jgi:hypothetical protein
MVLVANRAIGIHTTFPGITTILTYMYPTECLLSVSINSPNSITFTINCYTLSWGIFT